MPLELAVVVPVFNEEEALGGVLEEWIPELSRHSSDFRMFVLDDGSTDGTPEVLEDARSRHGDVLECCRHANRGHGQTCVAGYRLAAARGAEYVFQIDSDGQCDPAFFERIWALRKDCDVVYGHRVRREDGWKRVAASLVLRAAVFGATGAWCVDANSPYRLMRTHGLEEILDRVPADFHLANVALAVLLRRARPIWRHGAAPIRFRERSGGEPGVPIHAFGSRALQLVTQLRTLATASSIDIHQAGKSR